MRQVYLDLGHAERLPRHVGAAGGQDEEGEERVGAQETVDYALADWRRQNAEWKSC
jgi:hypothetical protein